jgi:hypothetical protein
MGHNQRNRVKDAADETVSKSATHSASSSSPADKSEFERLNQLKDRLLNMFLGLQRAERVPLNPEAQALRIQEEISLLIWMIEDWELQITSRN